MAHPQPHFSPSPYNSPHPTPPPAPLQFGNPAKRPRLSPGPASPYTQTSPQTTNGQMPNPYFPPQYQGPPPPNGYQAQPQQNAPPTPTGAVMGPPSRPVEEKQADLNDLSDVLFSTGIDIRSEEAALVQRNYSQQNDARSFETIAGSSFNSGSSSQGPFFDSSPYLSQNSPGARGSFYGAGSFSQPAVTPDVAEEAVERTRREAIRNKCVGMQYELRDPFLHSRSVYKKLLRHAKSNQVKFPDGRAVHVNELNQPPQYQVAMLRAPQPEANVEEHLAVISRFGSQAVLPSNGAIADIATLLSLAAKERVRAMLEDSAALARGRRLNAHGVVPSDLRDIAIGTGEPTEVTSAVSPHTKPLKRSFSEMNSLPTPISDSHNSPGKTIAYPNALATALMKSLTSENALEEARAAKRSKRNVDTLMSGEASRAGSAAGTPGPGTPGTPGTSSTAAGAAPDAPPKKGLSKKEQKRQADAKASEAQQLAATSSTLNLALGGSGNLFGKKKISWMSSAKPSLDTGFGLPRVPPAQKAAAAAAAAAGRVPAGKKLGEFREDKEGGAGIQMRDVILVMEPEPKEKRALAKAYDRLGPKR